MIIINPVQRTTLGRMIIKRNNLEIWISIELKISKFDQMISYPAYWSLTQCSTQKRAAFAFSHVLSSFVKRISKKYFLAGFVSFQAFCCWNCCIIGRTLISSSNCNKVNGARLISCLAQIHKHKYTNRCTNTLTMTTLVQKVYVFAPKSKGVVAWVISCMHDMFAAGKQSLGLRSIYLYLMYL